MSLLPSIDETKTFARTRNFFKYDLDEYMLAANVTISQITSPNFDSVGGKTFGNHVEENLLKEVQSKEDAESKYKAVCLATWESLKILNTRNINFHYRGTIIEDAYINGKSDDYLEYKLKCSRSALKGYKRQACVDFAWTFDFAKKRYGLTDDEIKLVVIES